MSDISLNRPDAEAIEEHWEKSESINKLNAIIAAATELRDLAQAGGDKQYAFELCIDNSNLRHVELILEDEQDRINDELMANDIFNDMIS